MGDETVEQNPQLRLQALLFRLGCSDTLVADKANLKSEIESVVAAQGALSAQKRRCAAADRFLPPGMSEWYSHFATPSSPLAPRDDGLIARLRSANVAKVVEIDEKIKDAEENLGESEVRDAKLERARHFDCVGDLVPLPSLPPVSLHRQGRPKWMRLNAGQGVGGIR